MIAISQQKKEELEAKIAQLEITGLVREHHLAYYEVYKEILSEAIVIPVENSWEIVNEKTDYGLSDKEVYPNGVIIKP